MSWRLRLKRSPCSRTDDAIRNQSVVTLKTSDRGFGTSIESAIRGDATSSALA